MKKTEPATACLNLPNLVTLVEVGGVGGVV